MSDIKNSVRKFILTEALQGEHEDNLRDDTPLIGSGILDSFNTLALIRYLEQTYKIEIEWSEIVGGGISDLNRIESFVGKKLGEKR